MIKDIDPIKYSADKKAFLKKWNQFGEDIFATLMARDQLYGDSSVHGAACLVSETEQGALLQTSSFYMVPKDGNYNFEYRSPRSFLRGGEYYTESKITNAPKIIHRVSHELGKYPINMSIRVGEFNDAEE